MKNKQYSLVLFISLILFAADCSWGTSSQAQADQTNMLKDSLVYLETSTYSFSALQPWRHSDLSKRTGYGCAVGDYDVLTTAANVADAAFITVRKFGQNELIPAKVKVVDYESNLCLLNLDRTKLLQPLRPICFHETYQKGAEVYFYWLSNDNRIQSGRGYVDRVEVSRSKTSYAHFINYKIGNVSQSAGQAHLFFQEDNAIGLGCWHDKSIKESGVIPAMVINQFLADAKQGDFAGFPMVGFKTAKLLDPALRGWLQMPETLKDGIYISEVYTLGTGSDTLHQHDVILAIGGKPIDAYGRFEDEKYQKISFEHLITSRSPGDKIALEVWRDGKKQLLNIEAKNFRVDDMLVPYYEYDKQGEYIVIGGFIFQKLTRKYFQAWGNEWKGRVDPHLYHYYRDMAFKPDSERRDVVILSRVLPAQINLGYQDLKQIVVSKYNSMNIHSIKDIIEAKKLDPEGKFEVIEFENNNPTVVLPREQLAMSDSLIGQLYGIEKMQNIE